MPVRGYPEGDLEPDHAEPGADASAPPDADAEPGDDALPADADADTDASVPADADTDGTADGGDEAQPDGASADDAGDDDAADAASDAPADASPGADAATEADASDAAADADGSADASIEAQGPDAHDDAASDASLPDAAGDAGAEACASDDAVTCAGKCGTVKDACGRTVDCTPRCGGTCCGTKCVDLAKDADHCGSCTRSCAGDACKAGACVLVTMAVGQVNAFDIEVDATTVYWTAQGSAAASYQDGAVRSMGKVPAGPVSTLVPGANYQPSWLALAPDGALYWANLYPAINGQSIEKYDPAAAPGKRVSTVRTRLWHLGEVQVDGDALFWLDQYYSGITVGSLAGAYQLHALTRTGSTERAGFPVSLPKGADQLGLGAGLLAWTNPGSGGGVAVAGSDGKYTAIDNSDDTFAPSTNGTSVCFIVRSAGAGGYVAVVPAAGGNVKLLSTQDPSPQRTAIDGPYCYWTSRGIGTANGSIRRARLDGTGSVEVLADHLIGPFGLATDATHVYVADMDGAGIVRVAK